MCTESKKEREKIRGNGREDWREEIKEVRLKEQVGRGGRKVD